SQGRTQRTQQLLAREGIFIRTRLRPMHGSAMAPQRRADRSDAGAPGPLLLPLLFSLTGHQLLVLVCMGTGPPRSPIVLDRFPEKVFIDRAKHFIGEIECPHLLAT